MKTKLMQLADAMANAYFEQGLERRVQDQAPEAARAALEAEIDRVCKDAERYRFIHTHPEWLGWDEDFNHRDIDAIVDRVMKGKS